MSVFNYFIGKWKTARDDGGSAEWVFKWGHDKNSVENKIVSKDGEGKVVLSNTGVLIWDEGNRRFVNVCVNLTGNRIDFLWDKISDNTWETWIRGACLCRR